MRIPSGTTDQYIYFIGKVAGVRTAGLSTFTVYRSRNGAAAVEMTAPTINETDSTNMIGVYELLMDEDMTIAAGNDTEEMIFHITQATMDAVDRTVELYRPETTLGNTLDVNANGEAGLDLDNSSGTWATAQFAADFLTNALIADSALDTEQFAADFLTDALIADAALVAANFAAASLNGKGDWALSSVATEGRLSELDAGNLPTDIAAIPTAVEIRAALFTADQALDTTLGVIDNVALVDTTTTNSDMVAAAPTAVQIRAALFTADTALDTTAGVLDVVGSVSGAVGSVSGHTNQSGDTYALANGTDGFTALSDQIDGIGAASGGALSYQNEADNIDSAIKTIAFDGTETGGTNASVNFNDGTYHNITGGATSLDIVYQFDIGGGRTAVEVTWVGYLDGANDELTLQVYNGSGWDTLTTIAGQATAVDKTEVHKLFSSHTLSGADLGKVLIRLECAGQTNPDLFTDQLTVSAVNIGQSVGYAQGAVWVDTNASNTNTESFVDGVADNPVSTLAAARTIADAVGLSVFHVAPGSSITLGEEFDGYEFTGFGYTVVMAAQSVSGTVFNGAIISGNDDGSNTIETHYHNCTMGSNTLGLFHLEGCQLTGDMVLAEAGTYILDGCFSGVAGTATPSIDWQNANEAKNLNMRHYSGGIEFENFGHGTADHNCSVEGNGQVVLNANCSNADAGDSLAIRGNFTLTDNVATWGGTVSDDARVDAAQILDAVTDDATKLDGSSLNAVEGKVDTVSGNVDDIETDTAELGDAVGASISADIAAILGDTQTESYAAATAEGTIPQILYLIQQALTEFLYTGTTFRIRKLDGAATAADMTLDSDTIPTEATRSP